MWGFRLSDSSSTSVELARLAGNLGAPPAQAASGKEMRLLCRGRDGASAACSTAGVGGRGDGKGELGLVGADHVGLTVPDIDEAVAWFRDVMGATAPLSFGPIGDPQGTLMQDLLGVDPRSVIDQITVLRSVTAPTSSCSSTRRRTSADTHPRNSDWSGHHVAFYVTDIDTAIAYMDAKGVQRFFGPFPLTAGPAAGQSINYFKTPFGTYIELISYPKGMAYQVPSVKPLWSPKLNGLAGGDLGAGAARDRPRRDHRADVAAAAAWFADVLGGSNPLTFGPFADPTGDFMHQLVDVDPRAVVDQIRMVRAGNGRASSCSSTRRPTRTARSGRTPTGAATISRSTCATSTRRSSTCRQGRAEAVRSVRRHRRPRRWADDQLLPDAVRNRHRADQLPARDGLQAAAAVPLWDPARQPPLSDRIRRSHVGRVAFSVFS